MWIDMPVKEAGNFKGSSRKNMLDWCFQILRKRLNSCHAKQKKETCYAVKYKNVEEK